MALIPIGLCGNGTLHIESILWENGLYHDIAFLIIFAYSYKVSDDTKLDDNDDGMERYTVK